MPESMAPLVDPAPELAAQDLSVLVWEDSLDYRDYATTHGFDDGRNDLSDEISVAAGITRYAACHRVAEADTLHTRFPRLLAATKAGLICGYALSAVLEATVELSPEHCVELETRLLTRAGRGVVPDLADLSAEQMAGLTDAQVMTVSVKASRSWLARVARDLTNRLDPTAAARKRERARKGRSVSVEHGADAMSWLSIYGPTARVEAANQHIDDLARAIDDPTDVRTLDAKRADVGLDLPAHCRSELFVWVGAGGG